MTQQAGTAQQQPKPRIWAVGGGKGGVGKSVITTSIAITLARHGQRCIMVDADLGGANLHTFVGLANPKRTLADLFRREVEGLHEILLATPFENLWLISGAKALLDMANPVYGLKMKIIKQIFSLHADHIFIDLGAGSSFNVLDFFLAAREQMLVVMPTPTSVENAYHFMKAVYYRKLRRAVREFRAEALVDEALSEKVQHGIRSPRDLMQDLMQRDPDVGEDIYRRMRGFRPRLIVNQVRRSEDRDLGEKMAMACRDFFDIAMDVPGTVRGDERVLASLKARRPVLDMFPHSPFADDIIALTRRLCPELEKRDGQRNSIAEL